MAPSTVSPLTSLRILWQDSPTSWIPQPGDVGTAALQQLAAQFLGLMGNDPDHPWTLVLDLLSPSVAVNAGGWTRDNLITFLSALAANNQRPNLIYHPNGESAIKDWLPAVQSPTAQQEYVAMIDYLAELNGALAAQRLPQFTGFIVEGNDFSRDLLGFQNLRQLLDQAGLDAVQLWNTGDWQQAAALAIDPTTKEIEADTPDAGVYAQIYDFWGSTNPLVGQPTDPDQAAALGSQMFNVLQSVPAMHPTQLSDPSRAPQIFNFSGQNDATSGLTDAPVFGGLGQAGVIPGKSWNASTFQKMLQAYASSFSAKATAAPTLGMWSAENGLQVLAPVGSEQSRPSAAYGSVVASDPTRLYSKYRHNLRLRSDRTVRTRLDGFVASAAQVAFGLFPLFDSQGRILSEAGQLLSVSDPSYLSTALRLAKQDGNWISKKRRHPGGVSMKAQTKAGIHYGLLVMNQDGNLASSLHLANENKSLQFAVEVTEPSQQRIGYEATPHQSNDYQDLVIRVGNSAKLDLVSDSVFEREAIGTLDAAPAIDVLWQDASALDMGTAYQIAQLISGNSANEDLKLILNIDGPNNASLNPTPSSHRAQGFTPIQQTPQQLLTFLGWIDTFAAKMGARWNGDLAYHPDAVTQSGVSDFADWAQFSAPVPSQPSKTFALTSDVNLSYEAYIDYFNYLNQYLAVNGSRHRFSEFLYEHQGTQFASDPAQIFGVSAPVRTYTGNPLLSPSSAGPALAEAVVSGTAAAVSNWDGSNQREGWGADRFYAQIYDLDDDTADYNPVWRWGTQPGAAQELTPTAYDPLTGSQLFTSFMVNPSASSQGPRSVVSNIDRMILPQATSVSPSSAFDPRAAFVFSYGPTPGSAAAGGDSPVFQSGVYPSIQWSWNQEQFSRFIDAFRSGLTSKLASVSQTSTNPSPFTNSQDLIVGVWGADRALDAWFGVPNAQNLANLLT